MKTKLVPRPAWAIAALCAAAIGVAGCGGSPSTSTSGSKTKSPSGSKTKSPSGSSTKSPSSPSTTSPSKSRVPTTSSGGSAY